MAYFPTVPEPDRAYLDQTSRTEAERKSSRAISRLVRGEEDPRVEIRRVDEAEARQRVEERLGRFARRAGQSATGRGGEARKPRDQD